MTPVAPPEALPSEPSPMPSAALSPEAVLQQAIACHQAGQLAHAEHGYLAVLAAQPDHPDASHNLGIVRMQQEDVAAALPLFHAALHAQPSQGQFWVSYIGALIQVQQPDAARQVLAQGQALGLQGAPVDALAAKLHAVPAAEAPLAMPEVTAPALPSVSKPVKRGGRVITPWQHLAPSRPTPKKRAATPQKSPAQSAKRATIAPAPCDGSPPVAPWVETTPPPAHGDPAPTAAPSMPSRFSAYRALSTEPLFMTKPALKSEPHTPTRPTAETDRPASPFWRGAKRPAETQGGATGTETAMGTRLPRTVAPLSTAGRAPQPPEMPRVLSLSAAHPTAALASTSSTSTSTPTPTPSPARPAQTPPPRAASGERPASPFWRGAKRPAEPAVTPSAPVAPQAAAHLAAAVMASPLVAVAAAPVAAAVPVSVPVAAPSAPLAAPPVAVAAEPAPPPPLAEESAAPPVSATATAEAYTAAPPTPVAVPLSLETLATDPEAASKQLFAAQYQGTLSAAALLALHRAFGDRVEAPFRGKVAPYPHARTYHRPLRVGFVSADLRQHPAVHFVLPLWTALDRTAIHLFAYANLAPSQHDALTQQLRAQCHTWHDVHDLDDDALAERIRHDEIDVLIEMSGHAAGNRLPVFARKPAPVQVAWLGYPHTTGLQHIDWRLTDAYADPRGAESHYTEKLWRLPNSFFCYQPMLSQPDQRGHAAYAVHPTPALSKGYVTFGSTMPAAKITPAVEALWVQVLQAAPHAKLLLVGETQGAAHSARLARLASQGIAAHRVAAVACDSSQPYLRYHDIDILLDPFAGGGGLSNCDALWMGVPVLSLGGETFATRVGGSALGAAEQWGWLAESEADYVQRASQLAADIPALNATRLALRPHLETRPLMDAPRFASQMTQALRSMWRVWGESQG